LAYVEGGCAATAYRAAYDVSPDAKSETVHVNASKLLADTKVTLRVQELQAANSARHAVTIDTLTAQLLEARQKAMAEPKGASAAVGATVALAKLHGFMTDKVETKVTGTMILTTVDRPQRETREQWIARRKRELSGATVAGSA
jgi:phage terminase small subunit